MAWVLSGGLPRGVAVVVLDTLRLDHAGPVAGVLRRWGFVEYPNAVAPSPWTVPSRESMLSGLYPSVHGVHEARGLYVPRVRYRRVPGWLPSLLASSGYRGVLLTANPLVSPVVGLSGFDTVVEVYMGGGMGGLSPWEERLLSGLRERGMGRLSMLLWLLRHGYWGLAGRLVARKLRREAGLLWERLQGWPLEKGSRRLLGSLLRFLRGGGRVFALVNLMEAHEPYLPREDALEAYAVNLSRDVLPPVAGEWRRYPGEARLLVERLRWLLERLEDAGVLDDIAVIVTSDHGQLLGEHGRIGHGVFLYDELLRVPLYARYPGRLHVEQGDVVAASRCSWVSLVDVKRLIAAVLEGSVDVLRDPYHRVAYAETYGLHIDLSRYLGAEGQRALEERYLGHRIAVYMDGVRAVYRPGSGIEEYRVLDPGCPQPEPREAAAAAERLLRLARLRKAARRGTRVDG